VPVTPAGPQTTKPAKPVAPLTGSDWFAARSSLAWRRIRGFTRAWVLIFGPLALGALLVPIAAGDPGASARSERERLASDTLRSAQRLRDAERSVALAESLHAEASSSPVRPIVPVTHVAPPITPTAEAAENGGADPDVAALGAAILEARRLRTVDAWLAVASQPPVTGGPRMRALADSLVALARARDELPSGPMRDQQAAPLTSAMSRVGYTILAIAEHRRASLALERGGTTESRITEASVERPPPPETISTPTAAPDTAASAARLRAARDSLSAAQRTHTEAIAAAERSAGSVTSDRPVTLASVAPAIVLFGVLLGGLAVRFSLALNSESNRPTVAHADEAERTIGASVLATVRDAPPDGPARFRPSGVDPFRMLYLGLTATGTRARTMIVTGSDAEIVAAVGARLAISAAADHRATLVVDLDPIGIALSRTLRERAEPGLTDALVGAFKWREVARPVGSSDGLPITMIPAGTERDLPIGAELEARRDDLTKFRAAFEFTILIVPAGYLDLAVSLVETSPLVLCAAVGDTTLERFAAEGAALRHDGRRLHGIVLWDAPRPVLPTRAELAAMVSTRKGRTPGGSFAAVQKAIEGGDKRH
jgi:Mrp family chromosome partitioning ATPase